jgi:hypothetical protein
MIRVTTWISAFLLAALPATAQPVSYHGMWSAAVPGSESGWRITITHKEGTITASWTTSSQHSNTPSTYSVIASPNGSNTFSGQLYRTRIVQTLAREQGGKAKAIHPVIRLQRDSEPLGRATFVFADENNGTLTYQEMSYHITRLVKERTR